jgi:hypothetical protein
MDDDWANAQAPPFASRRLPLAQWEERQRVSPCFSAGAGEWEGRWASTRNATGHGNQVSFTVAWEWANRERRAESDVHTFCMRIEGNVVNGRWQGNARLLWLADVSKEKQVFFATRYGDGLVVG